MGFLVYRSESKRLQNSRSETYMMENRPGGQGLTRGLEDYLKIANNTVGEQITAEQLIEKRKVMTISKAMNMKYRHHVCVK